jgi:hypothetical protein
MVVKDVIKQICEAGGFVRGSREADAVHHAVTSVYGSEYRPVTKDSTIRYGRQIEKNLYSHDSVTANRAVKHVREVIRNLK